MKLFLAIISIIALFLVWSVMSVEESISASVTINEFIDVTVSDKGVTGFNFGSIDPGTTNNKEAAQTDGFDSILPAVTVTNEPTTNTNAEISLKGTDFTGGSSIGIGNVSYDDDGAVDEGSDSGALPQTNLADSYPASEYAVLSPGTSVDIWFWLDVPTEQASGTYSSTFTFQGVGAAAVEGVCGNAVVESGEQCDDGNVIDGDGCSSTCLVEGVCGNGIVEGAEVCDDGNVIDGDGCSSTCQVEDADGDGFPAYVDCDDSNAAIYPGAPEVCNGIDDDCDAASADGSEDPQNGAACDGIDSDLCSEGTRSCSGGALVCSDATGSTLDVCNGINDDCDAASADGSEDPQNGAACDGIDSDLCSEGTRSCSGGALVCSDSTGSAVDLCNGFDDDCDAASADGSEDPLYGAACDGTDSDLCYEGTRSCSGGALVCSDATGGTADLCNGVDDDCDAASSDGSEDPQNGAACDGVDSDLCSEGTRSCSGGALVCSDSTGSAVDLCNGFDDDCDPASADGSEDPQNGVACDGPDSDFCTEGTRSCSAGALVCSDATGSTLEICGDLVDNDCDGVVDEGC